MEESLIFRSWHSVYTELKTLFVFFNRQNYVLLSCRFSFIETPSLAIREGVFYNNFRRKVMFRFHRENPNCRKVLQFYSCAQAECTCAKWVCAHYKQFCAAHKSIWRSDENKWRTHGGIWRTHGSIYVRTEIIGARMRTIGAITQTIGAITRTIGAIT